MTQIRLLSHRIRGFGPAEGSMHNLRTAIAAGAKLIEVDTRHTADQQIVVHHPPCLGTLTTGRGLIGRLSYAQVMKHRFLRKRDEHIAPLAAVLETVRSAVDLELWIDIKDFGLEHEYIDAVVSLDLRDRVRFISWIPEVIVRLHHLDSAARLGFSYACFGSHPRILSLLRMAAICLNRQSRPLAAMCRFGRLADVSATIPYFHPLGREIRDDLETELAVGFNHAHFIPGMPYGELLTALTDGRGFIGMFPRQATPGVVARAREFGLGVFVYSVDNRRQLTRILRRSPVDVVFSNDSDLVTESPVISVRDNGLDQSAKCGRKRQAET